MEGSKPKRDDEGIIFDSHRADEDKASASWGSHSHRPMEGRPAIPKFGDWNNSPERDQRYTDYFEQVLTVKKTPDIPTNTRPYPHLHLKQAEAYSHISTSLTPAAKLGSARTEESKLLNLNTKEEIMTSPYTPEMNRNPGPSLVAKKESERASDSRPKNGEDRTSADRSNARPAPGLTPAPKLGSTRTEESKLLNFNTKEEILTSPYTPELNRNPGPSLVAKKESERASDSRPNNGEDMTSADRSNARPAPNTGYNTMGKLKQRISDVVSYKKNVGVLQTKIQVLTEEVAQGQTLLMIGENDSSDVVRHWLVEADEILKGAQGVLEVRNYMGAMKRMCSTCLDPASSWKIGQLLRDIDEILGERKCLDLSSYLNGSLYCKKLKSRERMLQQILEVVMDTQIKMISVCGMIGVGKTTLVKELARRAHYDQLFDFIVMVQVSESVDVKNIQSQIANKIGLHLSDGDGEETRAHYLYTALEKKTTERDQEKDTEPAQQSKVLVLLDGLQIVIELEKVGIPYVNKGRTSCKVVLISRSADVCRKMGVEREFLVDCLNAEESKVLFQERLGDKVECMEIALENETYQHVENVLLRKCRGLPLMIDSLVCALRSMGPFKWEIIADQLEMYNLVEVDEVKEVPHAVLELCNSFIQTVEKQKFFLLCCLIQNGVEAPLEKLMRFGMGFGLFEADSLASATNQMNSWIHELKSLSLLLETECLQHVKMHDIIQDVVISTLSQGDNILPVLLDAGTFWHAREPYENCVAISMTPNSNYKCLNDLELPKLEAFLLRGEPSVSLPIEFFKGMQNLKILDISRINFVDFPLSVGAMKNLVTLNLEYCDISCGAISVITNLQRLQVLSLRGSTVEPLPGEFSCLNLRVLDLTDCRICAFCVDIIAKMRHLRELYLNGNYTNWSTWLIQFPLEVLEIMIPGIWQVSPGTLNFPNLRSFIVICTDAPYYRPLEDLHSFSRVLLIDDYSDLQLEGSGLRDLLPRTEFLHIKKLSGLCNGVGDLSIHEFSHLRKMCIEICGEMKCILDVSKLSLDQRELFPELEILSLKQLFNLTSVINFWQPCFSFFPKLQELRLTDLRQLSPFVLPIELAVRLRIMEVTRCLKLLYIFASSDINVPSVELPCMERLELKGLTGLVALDDLLEASITRNEPGRPCRRVLFTKKVNLPFLKEMHLENLEEIEEMCGFSPSEEGGAELLSLQSPTAFDNSPTFGNLKYLRVHACGKLESLFPFMICKSLSQLEKLEVDECHNMREVVTRADAEDDVSPTTVISFPKLQTLKLKYLDRLLFFYRGPLELKFPLLRELVLHSLKVMKAFTPKYTSSLETQGRLLFDGEIDSTSFKDQQDLASVSSMETELIEKRGDTTTCSKTLRLLDIHKVECFDVLSLIVPCELEVLRLSECNSMEEFVDDDNHKHHLCLKKLDLQCMGQLKRIPWNRLTNITSLVIVGLDSWISLIPTSMLVGGNLLPLLESIKVEDCVSLETIILPEQLEEEEQHFVKYGITLFPCLKKIALCMLPKLEAFSKGSYEAHFPSLETLEISTCPIFESFSWGSIRTPRLNSVLMDFKPIKADTFDDLNGVMRGLHRAKGKGMSISEDFLREKVNA